MGCALRFYYGLVLMAIFSLFAGAATPPGDAVLVSGDPPLTQSMVERRIAIWNLFMEVQITPQQHDAIQQGMIEAWKSHDKLTIDGTMEDMKTYGHNDQILANRQWNQSTWVESLRKMTDSPLARTLVSIYDAAHPERREYMRTHGMGNLVGNWKLQDAMLASEDRSSHRQFGATFTDTQNLQIFADGRFKYLWAHSHCSNTVCCAHYASTAAGNVAVQSNTLLLKSDSGEKVFQDKCAPATNTDDAVPAHGERLQWSIKQAGNALQLCLSTQPFNPWREGPDKVVCYNKQPDE